MKCPGCGFESFDLLETCKHCGAPMVATAFAAGPTPIDQAFDLIGLRFEPEYSVPGQMLPRRRSQRTSPESRIDSGGDFKETVDDAIEVGEDDLASGLSAGSGSPEEDDEPPFRIDDNFFSGHAVASPEVPGTAASFTSRADQGEAWPELGAEVPEPAWITPGAETGASDGDEPVIDRYDEVPEHFWAPEIAGLGRRSLALLADQVLLLAVLGSFFFGALLTLRLKGFATSMFLDEAGLRASSLPFALLAALLSFAYYSFFHWSTGRTPGKALAGIEVQTCDGGALCWSRAIRRWLGAALGLACFGVGCFWAFVEPRRRGWADLLSRTVVARPRRVTDVEG